MVSIVVEMSEQDFIAGTEFAADGTADGEGQRGHIGAEDYFVLIASEKIRHGGACTGNDGVSAAAGGIGAAGVGVGVRQIFGDGVDHALRYLSAARAVEEDGGLAVKRLRQRWELRADPGEIESSGFGLGSWHGVPVVRGLCFGARKADAASNVSTLRVP